MSCSWRSMVSEFWRMYSSRREMRVLMPSVSGVPEVDSSLAMSVCACGAGSKVSCCDYLHYVHYGTGSYVTQQPPGTWLLRGIGEGNGAWCSKQLRVSAPIGPQGSVPNALECGPPPPHDPRAHGVCTYNSTNTQAARAWTSTRGTELRRCHVRRDRDATLGPVVSVPPAHTSDCMGSGRAQRA
jgi:hypothetical protein